MLGVESGKLAPLPSDDPGEPWEDEVGDNGTDELPLRWLGLPLRDPRFSLCGEAGAEVGECSSTDRRREKKVSQPLGGRKGGGPWWEGVASTGVMVRRGPSAPTTSVGQRERTSRNKADHHGLTAEQ